MALTSVNTKGTLIKMGDAASPEVFTTIGGINDIPAITSDKGTLEDTAIDDDTRHYIYGIAEPSSITITMYWNPDDAQQTALITAHDGEVEKNFQAVMPDSPVSTYDFTGIVTSYTTPYGGINALLQWDVTIQLNENDSGDIVTLS